MRIRAARCEAIAMSESQAAPGPIEVDRNVWSTSADRVQVPEAAPSVSRPGDLVGRSMHLRQVRADAREADFVFSTDTIDRYGEIVEQVWQLDNFHRNPVALYGHNQGDLPIGYAKDVGVVDGELRGTIVFGSERANPKAEQVWQSLQEGTLRSVSVGFVPHTTRMEKREDRDVLVLSDNELWEISVVPVPANPEAVARMRARAMAAAQPNPPTHERGGDTNQTPNKESDVDKLDEVRAALDEKTRELATACQDRDAERSKVAELQERCATLEAERNERQAKINELTIAAVKRDLEALVGRKIAPTEVDGLAKLAALDRGLYDAQIEAIRARPDMDVVRDEPVVSPDPDSPVTDSAERGADVDLFAVAMQRNQEA